LEILESLKTTSTIKYLIKSLLCENPNQRLSANETLQHEWLRDEIENINNINLPCIEKKFKSCLSLPESFISRITSKRLSFDDSPI
jgi:hypothetical protein